MYLLCFVIPFYHKSGTVFKHCAQDVNKVSKNIIFRWTANMFNERPPGGTCKVWGSSQRVQRRLCQSRIPTNKCWTLRKSTGWFLSLENRGELFFFNLYHFTQLLDLYLLRQSLFDVVSSLHFFCLARVYSVSCRSSQQVSTAKLSSFVTTCYF